MANTPLDAAVEKAAEALWLDIYPGIPFSRLLDADRLTYLGHARAVIEALGLTEEAAHQFTHIESGRSSILTEHGDVKAAWRICAADEPSHRIEEVSRLVTPWETT